MSSTATEKRKTCHVIGMDLPIIADLGGSWFLVAHPNGAGIANEHLLTVLWEAPTQPDRNDLFPNEDDFDEVPADIRRKAVEEFEQYAWPRIKADFWPDGKTLRESKRGNDG